MPMYTFHLSKPDDGTGSFEAFELAHDGESVAKAGQMLEQHLSCDHVDVWQGERPVIARHREAPTIRPIAVNEGPVLSHSDFD